MKKKERVALRAVSFLVCIAILVGQWSAPLQVFAASRDDSEFYLFMAEYLDRNYVYEKENEIVENLEQVMVHHILHEGMEQQGGLTNTAVTIHNMANDWGYAIDGERGLYEQILLELIRNYLESDLFQKNVEEEQERIEAEILDVVENTFDTGETVKDSAQLADKVSKLDLSTWEGVLKLPKEYVMENINKLVDHFKLPVSDTYLLNIGFDTWDFMLEVILYVQLQDQIDGIRYVIEEIYRTTDNEELFVAAFHILNKLDAASSQDIWKLVEEVASTSYSSDLTITTMKDLVMMLLNVLGIEIEVLGLVSNMLFKLDTLAEAQLLLEMETEIEYVLKQIIRYKQNAYENNVKNSHILVISVMMLYEAYEYGLDIARNYSDAFFEANKNVIRLHSFGPKSFFKNYEEVTCTQNEFKSYLKASDGILATNRTVFYSGWLEYRQLYPNANKDSLMNYMGKIYASGLAFEQSAVVLEYQAGNANVQVLKAPEMTPEGAIVLPVRYESNDPTILSFENERINIVTLHQPGTVTVTATTEDGLYSTSQQVIVKEKEMVDEETWIPETSGKDYSDCYEDNEDGITVTKLIEDFVDKENLTYWLPREIDGKTVTEVDFSKGPKLEVRIYEGVPDGYNIDNELKFDSQGRGKIEHNGSIYIIQQSSRDVERIVLPDTVKRIADNCFVLNSVGGHDYYNMDVVLNEGLESIGENALQYRSLTPEVTLPSTLKEIGRGGLGIKGVETVYMQCPQLKEIPEDCFINPADRNDEISGVVLASRVKNIVFMGEHEKLTSVGAYGLARVKCVNLPDSIAKAGAYAFMHSSIDSFPESLTEIGEKCFYEAEISCKRLPESVKTIGRGAFQNAKYEELQIPNSVELIEEEAFWNDDQPVTIRTYGEAYGKQNGVLKGAFDSNLAYLEIPESIGTIQSLFSRFGGVHTQVVWTGDIDHIENTEPNGTKLALSVYLKESEYEGSFGFDKYEKIFRDNVYYEYLEIPYNYLDHTKEYMVGSYIKEAVIVGTEDEEKLEHYVELLKEAMDVNGKISYRDKDGKKVLLYIKYPSYFVKESKAKYENQADYLLDALAPYENQISDTVENLNICVSTPKGKQEDAELPKLMLGCWIGRNEDAAERAEQLGDYMIFEDIYLSQSGSRYFTVGFEGAEGLSVRDYGDYILSVDMKAPGLNRENVGVYHINECGKVTRLPVFFEEDGTNRTITFQTKELGQFALVSLNTFETKVWSTYRDELRVLYGRNMEDQSNSSEKEESVTDAEKAENTNADNQNTDNQNTDNQNTNVQNSDDQNTDNQKTDDQMTIFYDTEQEDGTVTIRKLQISQEERDSIADQLESGVKIADSLMEIITTGEQKTIQVSVKQTKNKKQTVLVFRGDEKGKLDQNSLLPESNIKELHLEYVPEERIRSNSAYYEILLDEEGIYYVAAAEEREIRFDTEGEPNRMIIVIGVISFLLCAVLFAIVIRKKRR